MRKLITLTAILLGLSFAAGCTYVVSARGGNSSMANDAWFTEVMGLGPYLPISTTVYYCPPMGNDGASTCMAAEMIEAGQATAAAAPAPAAAPAEELAPADDMAPEEGMEGDIPPE